MADYKKLSKPYESYELSSTGLVRRVDKKGKSTFVSKDKGGKTIRLTDDKGVRKAIKIELLKGMIAPETKKSLADKVSGVKGTPTLTEKSKVAKNVKSGSGRGEVSGTEKVRKERTGDCSEIRKLAIEGKTREEIVAKGYHPHTVYVQMKKALATKDAKADA